MGFTKTKVQDNSSEIMKSVENYFRPEFLGRLDDIVMFNGLPRSIIDELTDRYVKFYADNSGLKITLTKEDYDAVVKYIIDNRVEGWWHYVGHEDYLKLSSM